MIMNKMNRNMAAEENGNKLAKYIYEKRLESGLTRNALAKKTGISHTEIKRIEEGHRKAPSCSHLKLIADVLGVSIYEMLETAGILTKNESPAKEAFPYLKTKKQQEIIAKIAKMIKKNQDNLTDNDLDKLVEQVNMFLIAKTLKKDTINRR